MSTIDFICNGGMTSLKELPGQENVSLENKFFDEYTTYSPFSWAGSRRMTQQEITEFKKRVYVTEDSV